MQSLLTNAIEIAAATFILLMIVDFAALLATAWNNAGAQPQVEPVAQEQAIAPQAKDAIAPQVELAPAPQKVATLEWLVEHMPAHEVYVVEVPSVIELAKARLPKIVAPVVAIATREQLQSCSIRKLKQLAREIKLSGYSNMRLAQLATALQGKVATHQLAA